MKTIEKIIDMSKDFPLVMTEEHARYEANLLQEEHMLPPDKMVLLEFDPNLIAFTLKRLMDIFKPFIHNERSRLRFILEEKMAIKVLEIEAARKLDSILNPKGDIQVNIAIGDKIPKDFFEMPLDMREKVYPANTIAGYGKKPYDFVHKMVSPHTGEIIVFTL